MARDLEKTRSTAGGGNRDAARRLLYLAIRVAARICRGRQCPCQVGLVTGRRGGKLLTFTVYPGFSILVFKKSP